MGFKSFALAAIVAVLASACGGGGDDPAAGAAPTITSVSPNAATAGSTVTLTGANFTGATAVAFNGVAAAFTVASATGITATVPAAATSGRVTVSSTQGTATSPSNFTVTLPPSAARGQALFNNGINASATPCQVCHTVDFVRARVSAKPGGLTQANAYATIWDAVNGVVPQMQLIFSGLITDQQVSDLAAYIATP